MGKAHYKGKDLTGVRSLQRKLTPDNVGSEKREPTSLRGIANKAKTNKRHRFRDLYGCLNAELLLYCWHDLNKDAASGVDKVTAGEYAENLHANIEALADRLKTKCYRAKLVRRTFIPKDRKGVPRVKCRTARKKLQSACRRIKEWIKANRHKPGDEFFRGLNERLRGHYNYYGVRGNSLLLKRVYDWAIGCAFKWLNRRGGKRKSFTWEQFHEVLARAKIAVPRITEVSRRRVYV